MSVPGDTGKKKETSASKKAGGAARVHTVNESNFTGRVRRICHSSPRTVTGNRLSLLQSHTQHPSPPQPHPLFKSKTSPQQIGRLWFSKCPLCWDHELILATGILCSDTRSSSPSSCSRWGIELLGRPRHKLCKVSVPGENWAGRIPWTLSDWTTMLGWGAWVWAGQVATTEGSTLWLAGTLLAVAVRCASATPPRGRLLCREGKMSDCQRNTWKKINGHSSKASFTPKHHMLMVELPVLNSGVS